MSLSVLYSTLSAATGFTKAVDTASRSIGLTFSWVYLTSRTLGVCMDLASIIYGIASDNIGLAYVFIIHFVILRLPVLLLALRTACTDDANQAHQHILRPTEPFARTFWKGSFFAVIARIQYLCSDDNFILSDRNFLWIGIAAYAFVQGVEIALLAVLFFSKILSNVRIDWSKGEFEMDRTLFALLWIQGLLLVGGLLNNGLYFYQVAKRRIHLTSHTTEAAAAAAAAAATDRLVDRQTVTDALLANEPTQFPSNEDEEQLQIGASDQRSVQHHEPTCQGWCCDCFFTSGAINMYARFGVIAYIAMFGVCVYVASILMIYFVHHAHTV
jgi:hypothetical protein